MPNYPQGASPQVISAQFRASALSGLLCGCITRLYVSSDLLSHASVTPSTTQPALTIRARYLHGRTPEPAPPALPVQRRIAFGPNKKWLIVLEFLRTHFGPFGTIKISHDAVPPLAPTKPRLTVFLNAYFALCLLHAYVRHMWTAQLPPGLCYRLHLAEIWVV